VIGRREKVRFKTGFKSRKTVRGADMQRERIPIIRQRYTKAGEAKEDLVWVSMMSEEV